MTGTVNHDHNFKNLILDYPRQALAFFAPEEAGSLDEDARIVPIRQEQLKARLSDRFRELDVPLLVEWPDGRREALLFVLEEETQPRRFSIHRLAHYCLDLAELFEIDRVVPVVIFLHAATNVAEQLTLGGDHHSYLIFRYLRSVLADLQPERYWDSDNLVARLNLPNMTWPAERKIDIYAQAIKGLLSLEPDPDKQLKYIDFIDIYAALDDNERELYEHQYPEERAAMSRFAERFREEGKAEGKLEGMRFAERFREEGRQEGLKIAAERFREEGKEEGKLEGMQSGELAVLRKQLIRRFGSLDTATLQRLEQASITELEQWAENILDARTLEEVFTCH